MFEAVRKAKAEEFIPNLTDLRGKKAMKPMSVNVV